MGSRANIVVIEDGCTAIYYHQWVAQDMDSLIILGESNMQFFLESECDLEEDDCSLMDNVWAEGGLLMDYDHKLLMWFGGEDSEGCKPYLEALIELLRLAWPGWDIRWADKGNYDFGVYLGLDEDELVRIAGAKQELAVGNIHSIARDSPEDQMGVLTIKGAKGCFSRSTGCCFVGDLLSFGIELTSLYKSMVSSETVILDERPDFLLQRDVKWAVNPSRARRERDASRDEGSWATLACGYAPNRFPEYGIFIDLENKYLEYWTMCGYYSNPVNRALFPDDWTIEYKGADCSSHLSHAKDSITLHTCEPGYYFPAIEGRTMLLTDRGYSVINPRGLSSQEMQEYFETLYDAYRVSYPDFSFDSLVNEVQDQIRPKSPSNASLGLPDPVSYDEEQFDALDYQGPKYAEAHTLGEAIGMRGYDAFVERLDISDFDTGDPHIRFLGYAELWADFTWRKDAPSSRSVELERTATGVHERDVLAILRDESDECDEEIAFYDMKGIKLPYTPYHDYDDMNIEKWLSELFPHEILVCKVDSVTCFGQDGVRPDPDFCWRVYACKVTVYKVIK